MKKVCILTSVHPTFDTRIFYKQAKTLAKFGYDVTLIAQYDKDEIVEGINIIALHKPRNRFWRMLGTWRVFRLAFKQKADVYHFHDPELLPAGLLLKLLTKRTVIYDAHEDYPEGILYKHWIPLPVRKPVARFFNLLEKWGASRLDYIVAATDDIKTKFESTSKVAAIKNYPVLERFQSSPKREPSQPTLIFAGGLHQVRGLSEIVRAMAYLDSSRDARLVLYGKFSPASYQAVVQGLKGFDRVEYRGSIDPKLVWQKLGQATIGIVCYNPIRPALVSMPNKLFECMAAGLPIIASDFPLWKEIVEGNKCGLTVNPLHPQEIARVIDYMLDHPDEARHMGENGRKAVLEKYNWETEGRRLLELYERLIDDY